MNALGTLLYTLKKSIRLWESADTLENTYLRALEIEDVWRALDSLDDGRRLVTGRVVNPFAFEEALRENGFLRRSFRGSFRGNGWTYLFVAMRTVSYVSVLVTILLWRLVKD